jgi:hypothetical protein
MSERRLKQNHSSKSEQTTRVKSRKKRSQNYGWNHIKPFIINGSPKT